MQKHNSSGPQKIKKKGCASSTKCDKPIQLSGGAGSIHIQI